MLRGSLPGSQHHLISDSAAHPVVSLGLLLRKIVFFCPRQFSVFCAAAFQFLIGKMNVLNIFCSVQVNVTFPHVPSPSVVCPVVIISYYIFLTISYFPRSWLDLLFPDQSLHELYHFLLNIVLQDSATLNYWKTCTDLPSPVIQIGMITAPNVICGLILNTI